jgi:hypothetical protein
MFAAHALARIGKSGPMFVGASGTSWATSGALSISATSPSGLPLAGDLRLVLACIVGTGNWTPASGWTEDLDTAFYPFSGFAAHKTLVSGDGSASFSHTSSTLRKNAMVAAFRNAAFGTVGAVGQVTGINLSVPGITAAKGLLVLFHGYSHASTLAVTPPPGFVDTGATAGQSSLFIAPCSAGATGDLAVSLPSTPDNGQMGFLINIVAP